MAVYIILQHKNMSFILHNGISHRILTSRQDLDPFRIREVAAQPAASILAFHHHDAPRGETDQIDFGEIAVFTGDDGVHQNPIVNGKV